MGQKQSAEQALVEKNVEVKLKPRGALPYDVLCQLPSGGELHYFTPKNHRQAQTQKEVKDALRRQERRIGVLRAEVGRQVEQAEMKAAPQPPHPEGAEAPQSAEPSPLAAASPAATEGQGASEVADTPAAASSLESAGPSPSAAVRLNPPQFLPKHGYVAFPPPVQEGAPLYVANPKSTDAVPDVVYLPTALPERDGEQAQADVHDGHPDAMPRRAVQESAIYEIAGVEPLYCFPQWHPEVMENHTLSPWDLDGIINDHLPSGFASVSLSSPAVDDEDGGDAMALSGAILFPLREPVSRVAAAGVLAAVAVSAAVQDALSEFTAFEDPPRGPPAPLPALLVDEERESLSRGDTSPHGAAGSPPVIAAPVHDIAPEPESPPSPTSPQSPPSPAKPVEEQEGDLHHVAPPPLLAEEQAPSEAAITADRPEPAPEAETPTAPAAEELPTAPAAEELPTAPAAEELPTAPAAEAALGAPAAAATPVGKRRKQLRKQLDAWKEQYHGVHGKAPTKKTLLKDPSIAGVYEEYIGLREEKKDKEEKSRDASEEDRETFEDAPSRSAVEAEPAVLGAESEAPVASDAAEPAVLGAESEAPVAAGPDPRKASVLQHAGDLARMDSGVLMNVDGLGRGHSIEVIEVMGRGNASVGAPEESPPPPGTAARGGWGEPQDVPVTPKSDADPAGPGPAQGQGAPSTASPPTEDPENKDQERKPNRRKHELAQKLNAWKESFRAEHGKEPSKSDLRSDPVIGPLYEEYLLYTKDPKKTKDKEAQKKKEKGDGQEGKDKKELKERKERKKALAKQLNVWKAEYEKEHGKAPTKRQLKSSDIRDVYSEYTALCE